MALAAPIQPELQEAPIESENKLPIRSKKKKRKNVKEQGETTMKYIVYCRKSTDEKDKQVLSIDQQIAELKEFSKREHLEIIDFVIEAKTAKVPGREQFAILLRRIEKGEAQGIVSWHPDRLARNSIDGGRIIYLLDTGKLQDLKFPSFWFDSTPQGKFMLNIAFGQSKYYVDNLSENVKRGMRHKLRLGIWPLKAPLGYINDSNTKTIRLDSEKAKIIKKAFELFAEDKKSYTEISLYLHKLGISRAGTKHAGEPLKVSTVKKMLTNRFYIGILRYGGEYYEGKHEQFISKELFQQVQKLVPKIKRPRQYGHDFAYSGLAKCGECNAAITSEKHTNYYKNGTTQTFIYYRCTKKLKPCTQKYVSESEIQSQVRKLLLDVALPEKWGKQWLEWLERDEKLESVSTKQNVEKLEQEVKTLDQKLNKLLDAYLEGVIESEVYKKKKNEIFEEKLKLNEEISKIQTDGSSWLEPMREFVERASSLEKIARANNTNEELASFVKTVGSNFFLTNRQLVPTFNRGFLELWLNGGSQSQSWGNSEKTKSVTRVIS